MHLVILHHHLNPGGVTRVIENHLRALAAAGDEAPERVMLLHGGRAESWPQANLEAALQFELTLAELADLDYEELRSGSPEPLPSAIAELLGKRGFAAESTILHWHNHSLGKNSDVPAAVVHLAKSGYRTLLQIHDFAEDFRPANYRRLRASMTKLGADSVPAAIYPQSPAVHYATLNGRDRSILAAAGVPDDRLHLLPNPISEPPACTDPSAAAALVRQALALRRDNSIVVSPVRGIRRKNVGELLLWSAANPAVSFVLTLEPKNPVERIPFQRWRELPPRLRLQCRLGVPIDAGVSYDQMLAASNALMSTSVAEGFGMIFLESWLAGRRLIGRNLPAITAEFVESGLDFAELYEKLAIPNDWIPRQEFTTALSELCRAAFSAIGAAPPDESELARQFAAMFDRGIDFAQLSRKLQSSVIERVASSSSNRERLLQRNPQLQFPDGEAPDLIAANAAAVRRSYSIEAFAGRLSTVYAAVRRSERAADVEPPPQGDVVLSSFMNIDRLHPVRLEA